MRSIASPWRLTGALAPLHPRTLSSFAPELAAKSEDWWNLHYGRRYPTLAAFLHQSVEEITDEVVDLYDRCLAQTYSRAAENLMSSDWR